MKVGWERKKKKDRGKEEPKKTFQGAPISQAYHKAGKKLKGVFHCMQHRPVSFPNGAKLLSTIVIFFCCVVILRKEANIFSNLLAWML